MSKHVQGAVDFVANNHLRTRMVRSPWKRSRLRRISSAM